MTMYTRLYLTWRTSKDLLANTQGSLLNVMWQPGWEGSLGEKGYVHMYGWILHLYTTIQHELKNKENLTKINQYTIGTSSPSKFSRLFLKIVPLSLQARLSKWLSGKESSFQCRRCKRHRFSRWVGKIPWRREWQPTAVFLPGESHGHRSLVGYSPWGHKRVISVWVRTVHKSTKQRVAPYFRVLLGHYFRQPLDSNISKHTLKLNQF